MKRTLKIATRTSVLAIAQSQLVVNALKEAHPGLNVELIGVKNVIGDQDKTTPLSKMDTVGVFTKGIDELVLSGEADCAIHSLKDIGTKRPGNLTTVCTPKRAAPHDVVLFRHDILDRIKNGQEIVIGSSSPRRANLVPPFLKKALPQVGDHAPRICVKSLRGNAHSRIQKMLGLKENDVELHGIVLAFAGLSRLFGDQKGREVLEPLLKQVRWMVLPLTACPSAPGQGSLAIETCADRKEVIDLFEPLNHTKTATEIRLERDVLIAHGGGCHQAFGVTALKIPSANDRLLLVKGHNTYGQDISETRWLSSHLDLNLSMQKIWNGLQWRSDIFETDLLEHPPISADAVFVSHSRAVEGCNNEDFFEKRLWTSGTKSWFRLAEKGIWVEGCGDGFGFDYLIKTLLTDPALQLPACKHWNILTHDEAGDTWDEGKIIPTYHLAKKLCPEAIAELQEANHIYWSSYSQFKELHQHAKPTAVHMAGPGKTAKLIREHGIKNLVIAPDFATLQQETK